MLNKFSARHTCTPFVVKLFSIESYILCRYFNTYVSINIWSCSIPSSKIQHSTCTHPTKQMTYSKKINRFLNIVKSGKGKCVYKLILQIPSTKDVIPHNGTIIFNVCLSFYSTSIQMGTHFHDYDTILEHNCIYNYINIC